MTFSWSNEAQYITGRMPSRHWQRFCLWRLGMPTIKNCSSFLPQKPNLGLRKWRKGPRRAYSKICQNQAISRKWHTLLPEAAQPACPRRTGQGSGSSRRRSRSSARSKKRGIIQEGNYTRHPVSGSTLRRLPPVWHQMPSNPQPWSFVSKDELNGLVQ